ncbi:MAG: phospholipid carrier-dependent glycosyltransferase [Anaerolineaceae bacterium]|nr:phospholipid carrier-dependent glycosyltransferase [Anaerolineaceae bacterium]
MSLRTHRRNWLQWRDEFKTAGDRNLKITVTNRYLLLAILVTALALRLAHVLPLDHAQIYADKGGDSWWYLKYGFDLVRGQDPAVLASGPIYLLFVGIPQLIFPPATAVLLTRLLQAVMSTATCYFVYRLASAISHDVRAGLIAATVLAISPAFIIESGQILTETLFIFLLSGGLFLYVATIEHHPSQTPINPRLYGLIAFVGLIFGIATLTRAVLLAFPLGLVIHLLMVYGWRRGFQLGLTLLIVFAITLSPWTIYNRVKWGQTVVAAQGFGAMLFIGATDSGWQGPQQTDNALQQSTAAPVPTDPAQQQQVYTESATNSILNDIPGWLRSRVDQLSNAILQPHGTVFFAGESLKDMTSRWLSTDRSLSGFLRLTQGDNFWPKLAIYLFHDLGMLAGVIGIWLSRRNWRLALPLVGLIAYFLLTHFILYVIPRYLFSLDMLWWVFGGISLAALSRRIPRRTTQPSPLVEKVS